MREQQLDFAAFFKGLHGVNPFPWQQRLAERVVSGRSWPELLDLPTGSGKTAAIDVAVFHLASQASFGTRRTAPLRILFVIDRRIVVDEAHQRALRIATGLRQSVDPAVRQVADALKSYSGGPPLSVARLRGGTPQERDWARSPAQPLVAVSTVDQVGSRLLFRGYGVSPRMRPVHAGLVGADALWLLDEVHLAAPLVDTLRAVIDLRSRPNRDRRPLPFGMVRLSATPGLDADTTGADERFVLGADDRRDPVLGPRLRSSKLTEVRTSKADPARELAREAVGFIERFYAPPREQGAEAGPASRVAVICNQVSLARRTFEQVQDEMRSLEPDAAVVRLLIGPVRPLDRDRLLEDLKPLQAKPGRSELDRPFILVSTQTIEAGADLDFDAILTQVAPLDSLRQRFGRLDRLGGRQRGEGLVLVPGSKEGWAPIERIYGDPARRTAEWLTQRKHADFGIEAEATGPGDAACLSTKPAAPVPLAPYFDLWSTTSPEPPATPEPQLFLHGPEMGADVQIVWRADVEVAAGDEQEWANVSLEACPPSALEAISIPVWAARDWLRQTEPAPFGDLPEREPGGRAAAPSRGRPYYRLSRSRQGGDAAANIASAAPTGPSWNIFWADQLRPGDLIVVPAAYGGADHYGWRSSSRVPVTDLGAVANYRQREKVALRLTSGTVRDSVLADGGDADELWRSVVAAVAEVADVTDAGSVIDALRNVSGLPGAWDRLLAAMMERLSGIHLRFKSEDSVAEGFVVWGAGRLPGIDVAGRDEEAETPGAEAVTDRWDSWRAFREVTLDSHQARVARHAREFGHAVGLPTDLIAVLDLAGRLHDLGKADPRFQADLGAAGQLGGIPADLRNLLSSEQQPLAKSRARATFTATPRGFRHEALSVALAQKHPEVACLDAGDRDLLLWLLGTHHGYGRPFFPASRDPAPGTLTEVRTGDGAALSAEALEAPLSLDQGWPELAQRVRVRYGHWELAAFESMLRLADHRASAEEEGETCLEDATL
ncbi:MAG TPA: type I-U CRISPR-associated helicase/endonuclease Cas3 [Chloroflexota bacterium]|nr:type I-U CRISPR-associated helicase/endonuclease Cas3 [Chloroflexota bacterium]